MLDDYCQWAENNEFLASVIFVVFLVVVVGAIVVGICWPRRLPDLNDPKDFGADG